MAHIQLFIYSPILLLLLKERTCLLLKLLSSCKKSKCRILILTLISIWNPSSGCFCGCLQSASNCSPSDVKCALTCNNSTMFGSCCLCLCTECLGLSKLIPSPEIHSANSCHLAHGTTNNVGQRVLSDQLMGCQCILTFTQLHFDLHKS